MKEKLFTGKELSCLRSKLRELEHLKMETKRLSRVSWSRGNNKEVS